ncbi:C40 family peptidase [Fusibacter ferrireducens]|uniref:C40 family peptidase n=1 Tax=Fusibacter ferrireducens TaxID=2785058 RepID=A0ABR9ZP82_9FIRM|nr:NlpC/P60 family protein [Fusibacter ferrireducens]MBF4692275.1 C40 family peptidase [Fusibacter ferrireducens]
MAIDPATLKAAAKMATTVLSDEKGRRIILIACLIPFIIILLVLSSPFAIYFSVLDGQEETISVVSELNEMKRAFRYRIEQEQADASVDHIQTIVVGSEDGTLIDNTEDVLIAYAVKYNVTKKGAVQIAILSEDQVNKLKQVYQDMNLMTISYETSSKKVDFTTTDDCGEPVTKTKTVTTTTKIITIDCLTAEEIGAVYGFDDVQNRMITEMRQSGYGIMMVSSDIKTFLTRAEIDEIKSHIPEGMVIENEKVVEAAKSLVGKVHYFWGGKSLSMGWDNRWGKDMEVTAPGSSSTGTVRPFGLDCSGFVTWTFANAGLPADSIESTMGHGTTAQWNVSTSIPANAAMAGDLAFLATPGTRKVNHIGIVIGRNEEGQIMVIHCSSGANNVSISTAERVGFQYFRRPAVLIN